MNARSLTVFITGGTAGFGEAAARKFLSHGSKVIITGRRKERLAKLTKELGPKLLALHADVRDAAKMEEAIRGLPPDFKEVDVLVNNAGCALGLEPADKADLADWEAMVDINIKGLMTTTRLVLPGMAERNRGHIINLGSVAGTYPYPGGNVYGATKAFVHQFSLNLRADLLGKQIRVTCLEPGMAETEFSMVRFRGDEDKAKGVYQGFQPMTAEDIAQVIYFCATLPPHVNINTLELMPTMQAFGPFPVARGATS